MVPTSPLRDQLERARDRFFDLSIDLFAILRLDGRIHQINPRSGEVLGFSPEELADTDFVERVDPGDRECFRCSLRNLLRGKQIRNLQIRLVCRDGTRKIFSLSLPAPQPDDAFLYAVARDMTDWQILEMERLQSQKLQAVGQLAAGIAHELNTPIQFVGDSAFFLRDAIEAWVELRRILGDLVHHSEADGTYEEERRAIAAKYEELDCDYFLEHTPRAAERMLEGVGRVADIVRALKEFAHPDRREKTLGDVNHIVANTLIVARNELKYVAEVETEYGELPSIACYPGDLGQVFLNLLINAAHAIAGAGGSKGNLGKIRVRTFRDDEEVVVEISDTGPGIPQEVQGRIFDPFFTTKPVGQGTGQGLPIARTIVVQKHGGSLRFRSPEGEGATFIVRLPIEDGRST